MSMTNKITSMTKKIMSMTLMLQNPRLYLGVCIHSMLILQLLSEEIKIGGNSKLKAKEVVCLFLEKLDWLNVLLFLV